MFRNVALEPYVLKQRSRVLNVDAIDWPMALWLATLYGWDESATSPPRSLWNGEPPGGGDVLDAALDAWGGSWLARQGQWAWFDDSTSLAEALAAALPDVPAHNVVPSGLDRATVRRDALLRSGPVDPREWFGGRRHRLLELIGFCRNHVFEIW
jgi:hypothetical protein